MLFLYISNLRARLDDKELPAPPISFSLSSSFRCFAPLIVSASSLCALDYSSVGVDGKGEPTG